MSAERNLTPLMQMLRNYLLGRKYINSLRFMPTQAPRTVPAPNLPPGVAHKLSANYYYARDGRREVKPPLLVADNTSQTAIASGEKAAKTLSIGASKLPAPGPVTKWD